MYQVVEEYLEGKGFSVQYDDQKMNFCGIKFVFVCLILHIEAKDLVVNKAARMMLYCIGHRPALPHPFESM